LTLKKQQDKNPKKNKWKQKHLTLDYLKEY
jgi:hypothetical protein